jgi:transposase
MNPETLRKRIRQDEIDHGDRDGITAAAAREIRELKRKNGELEQTIEILKAASFFVLESDPRSRR